jgi:hypothetical protein
VKGTVNKEFVRAGQTVNFTYYCDILWWLHEDLRRLHPKLWWQKHWLLHYSNAPSHASFHQGTFTKNNMAVVPHPFYFSLTPAAILTQMRRSRQNRRWCWTLTKHSFQDVFTKIAEALVMVHMWGREVLRGWWWPVGPNLVFDQMAAPVLEIVGGSLYSWFH